MPNELHKWKVKQSVSRVSTLNRIFTWLFSIERPPNDNKYGCMQSKNENEEERVLCEFFHWNTLFDVRWHIEAFKCVTDCIIAAAVQCSSSCAQTPSLWIRALAYSSRMNPSNHPLKCFLLLNIKVSLGFTQNESRHQLYRFSLPSSPHPFHFIFLLLPMFCIHMESSVLLIYNKIQ